MDPLLIAAEWHQLFEMLDIALELSSAECELWLARLEAGGELLAPKLRALLASRAKIDSAGFLAAAPVLSIVAADARRKSSAVPDQATPMAAAPPPAGEVAGELRSGARLGAYVLRRELASGGMGAVWLAERADGLFRRPVALKLPHPGPYARLLAERFAREREILATLEHPNIARLYDAGVTAAGQPYLALEYVEGERIDVFCDRLSLGVPARLRLFLQVLRAVQFAHAHLVVHRDLKPANILVNADGEVRLLDFGIAKLIGDDAEQDAALTQLVGLPLTPDYASPEQIAAGPISTAADIYSLGVVLYELLTGSRPYRLQRDTRAALEAAIAAADIAPASRMPMDAQAAASRAATAARLARTFRGDLDTVVLKALRKSPGDRYDSAAAFADDLERYLDGRPVLARPDSPAYRAHKFVLRHKLESAFAAAIAIAIAGGAYAQGAVLAALGAGSGVALWQARVARRQSALAQRERRQAEQAAEQARRAESRALAIQRFLTELFSANSLAQADVAMARQLTAQQLLDRGVASLEGSMQEAPDVRVALWNLFGRLYDDLDLPAQSMAMRWRAAGEARRVYGAGSRELAHALVQLAGALRHRADQRPQALEALEEAGAILARVAPRSEDYSEVLLAETFWLRDREPAKAVARGERALRLRREAAVGDASLAEALIYLGWARNSLGSYVVAEQTLAEARALYERAHGPRSSPVGHACRGLAEAYAGQLRFAEAADALNTAIDIQLATHTRNETLSADGRYLRAQALLVLGRRDEAARERAALAAFVCPPDAAAVASMNRLRLALLAAAEGDGAAVFDACAGIDAGLPGQAPGLVVAAFTAAARLHLLHDDLRAARLAADHAAAIVAERGATAARAAELAAATAELLARDGKPAEAMAALEGAQLAYRIEPSISAPSLELGLGKARVLAALHDWAAINPALRRWLDLRPGAGVQLPLAAEGEVCLLAGMAASRQGLPASAHFERALAAFGRSDVPHSPRLARARRALRAHTR